MLYLYLAGVYCTDMMKTLKKWFGIGSNQNVQRGRYRSTSRSDSSGGSTYFWGGDGGSSHSHSHCDYSGDSSCDSGGDGGGD